MKHLAGLLILAGLWCGAARSPAAMATPAPAARGTISGTVHGGSGIVVPNAQVAATNTRTQAATRVTATNGGRFELPGLVPGRYRVSVVSMAGFPPVSVELGAGRTATVDLRIGRKEISPRFARPPPLTMAQLRGTSSRGVSVAEVSDYVYGHYQGDFPSPPHADGNPRKAVIIFWKDFPFRFVFSHEASYCPWFELASGAALSYQFFEGNAGWAELFNDQGRKQRNSFVEILEAGPDRVWVRWTYFGMNVEGGQPAYRGSEDFWAYPNGLIVRRQAYHTLRPGDPRGYAREPIEMIGICPVGKRWFDVLRKDPAHGESHALAVLDPFSSRRYDVYWKRRPGTLWEATARRSGADWKQLDDAAGVVLVVPMKEGAPFCVFGDASGFGHDFTRIKEHSHTDTGGLGWVSQCWDHWPIGWLNSQGHPVDGTTLGVYPNHFSPAGMDFFALPDEEVERGTFYSLIGVGGENLEDIRRIARQWLDPGPEGTTRPASAAGLPAPFGPIGHEGAADK